MKVLVLFAFISFLPASARLLAVGGGMPGGDTNEAACFAAGTPVATPAGARPIESLATGDVVYTYEDGALRATGIRNVFTGTAQVLAVEAGGMALNTTVEHPLLARSGFAPAGTLKPGDEIALLAGTGLRWVRITSMKLLKAPETVYNLEVGPPHNFIAGGFIVHNYYGGSTGAARRRRELREQYGTDTPAWGSLTIQDKLGTAVCALILLVVVGMKLQE